MPDAIRIWSPDYGGHHLLYAKLVAEYAKERGIAVSIYSTKEGLSSDEFRLHLGRMGVASIEATSFQATLKSLPPNALLVICHVDRIMTELLRLRVPKGANVSALVMRPSRTMESRTRRLAKAGLTSCLSLRRRIRVAELSTIGDREAGSIPQVPDPVVQSSPAIEEGKARDALGLALPRGCFLGLAIGLLSSRKRPELLVGALDYLPDRHHLLFAGHQDPAFRQVVDSARDRYPGRIHIRNEHLSEANFGLCLSAASYVVALHPTGISSGVVLQAISIGLPVVVSAGTPLARVVEEQSLGSASLGTPISVARAIRIVLSGELSPQTIRLPTTEDFVTSLLGPI